MGVVVHHRHHHSAVGVGGEEEVELARLEAFGGLVGSVDVVGEEGVVVVVQEDHHSLAVAVMGG